MQLTVNGESRELADGSTAGDLLREFGLTGGWVVVECNGEALLRSEVDVTVLADGDVVELIRAVAGG
ncbi:MAG TPA: sulfur carrier protein ThiS [Mycobacteriales bacterium]|nr:sulfur carrier protein ThiS [Mycobacteriales bacterium]